MFGDISSFISNIRHLVLQYQRAVRSHSPETQTRTVVNTNWRILLTCIVIIQS